LQFAEEAVHKNVLTYTEEAAFSPLYCILMLVLGLALLFVIRFIAPSNHLLLAAVCDSETALFRQTNHCFHFEEFRLCCELTAAATALHN
jgi:hypothetical protein